MYAQANDEAKRFGDCVIHSSKSCLTLSLGCDGARTLYEWELYNESGELHWSAVDEMEGKEGVVEEALLRAIELRDHPREFVLACWRGYLQRGQ